VVIQKQATLGHLFLYAYLPCMTLSNTHASTHRFSSRELLLHVALHDWIEPRSNSWASALRQLYYLSNAADSPVWHTGSGSILSRAKIVLLFTSRIWGMV